MKQKFKKFLPKSLLNLNKIFKLKIERVRLFYNDYKRFNKYSFGIYQPESSSQLGALITKNYHSIEKGLSYKNTRLGFGKEVINTLFELMELYEKNNYDTEDECFKTAISTLEEYVNLHESMNYNVTYVKERLNRYITDNNYNKGGAKYLSKKDILLKSQGNYYEMSNSRYSVRDFSDRPVDLKSIYDSIEIAKKTPSVCNRQPWKVRIIKDQEKKNILRNNQNGNSGFGHQVDTFLLITTDNSFFKAPKERNQSYIDGGLFSMSLLHALHYNGLATCSLSASISSIQEKNIREGLNINESESLILFVAVGHYVEEEFKVPKSNRYNTENFYEVL